mgnify:CR=1 FL=1
MDLGKPILKFFSLKIYSANKLTTMKIIKWPKWYVILSTFFVLAFLIYHFRSDSTIKDNVFKKDIGLRFRSVIIDKYIDHENHNYKTCILLEGTDTLILFLDFDKSGLFNYLEVGDSVFKDIGDSLIIVKRKDDIRHFYLKY